MNLKVNWFFDKATQWKDEYDKLRMICLDSGLQEELKWGCPCYTLKSGGNVVLIHGFKEFCALLFFKGVLVKDPQGLLIQQTENVQGPRQARFTSLMEILENEAAIKALIKDAAEVEKSGAKVELKKTTEFTMPDEFRRRLDEMPDLKTAFEALTPGRQRGYLLHFSSAKQAKTREARIEKNIPQIMAGKGLED